MKNKNDTPLQKPKNFGIDELHQITKVDRWFLHGLANIANTNNTKDSSLRSLRTLRLKKGSRSRVNEKRRFLIT